MGISCCTVPNGHTIITCELCWFSASTFEDTITCFSQYVVNVMQCKCDNYLQWLPHCMSIPGLHVNTRIRQSKVTHSRSQWSWQCYRMSPCTDDSRHVPPLIDTCMLSHNTAHPWYVTFQAMIQCWHATTDTTKCMSSDTS